MSFRVSRELTDEVYAILMDMRRVREAIRRAYESCKQELEKACGRIRDVMHLYSRTLGHLVLRMLRRIRKQITAKGRYDPHRSVRMEVILRVKVKLLTVSFLEHEHVAKTEQMLRTQDRNSDDDTYSDSNSFNAVLA